MVCAPNTANLHSIMDLLQSFLRLIRWKNLVIVLLTQWFIWACVVFPLDNLMGQKIFLSPINFTLLSLSTLLIAAAGYIINDYFDIRIDMINRPEKVIVGAIIRKRWVMFWHSLFNVIGITIAFYLAYHAQKWWLPFLQIMCTVILVVYSVKWKREYVIGNFIVSLLTGLTVMIIALYEIQIYPFINFHFFIYDYQILIVNPFWVIVMYAYFAFMLTWIREIVKDMEDIKGDANEYCNTMPLKIGLKKTVAFVRLLSVFTIIPLLVSSIKLLTTAWYILGIYLIIAIIIPLILWNRFLLQQTTQVHFAKASRYLKLLMIIGIFSLLLYYYLQYF